MLSRIDDFILAAAFLRARDPFTLLADSFNPQSRMLDGLGSLFVDVECGGSAVAGPRRSLIFALVLLVAQRPLAGTRVVWVARSGAKNHDG